MPLGLVVGWLVGVLKVRMVQEMLEKFLGLVQGGPPTSYKWSYGAPISRVISPQLAIYFRPFIGLITSLIIGRGPPCGIYGCFQK